MNLEQARIKLDNISRSTAIKHPKVLVAELCVIVKFLLDEIGNSKNSMLHTHERDIPTTTLRSLEEPNIDITTKRFIPKPSGTLPIFGNNHDI